jgi:hypothetical protein
MNVSEVVPSVNTRSSHSTISEGNSRQQAAGIVSRYWVIHECKRDSALISEGGHGVISEGNSGWWVADVVSRCWLNNSKSQDMMDIGDRPLQRLMAVLIRFGCPGASEESVEEGKSKGSFIRRYYRRIRETSDFGTDKQ